MADSMTRRQFLSEALTNAENERVAIGVRLDYLRFCAEQPEFKALKDKNNPVVTERNSMESKMAGVNSWIEWLKKEMILQA